ncbi:MAG TPA: phospholipase D-like domain-containing protein [Gemmatimonadaceae bacterium]|nr:phospholipase D-like domain-containing protein [Gemmatimonadaceae bacterium]
MITRILRALLWLLLFVFAFIGVEYTTRGTPLSRVSAIGDHGGPPGAADSLFERTMELFTGITLDPGNRVEVLANGDETYPRLWRDLRSARQSITLQMYYCKPGRMADTLKAIISEQARRGVRVLFLHDAFGSQNLTDGYLDSLRAAGVKVAIFRPVHWYSLHKAQSRSHIRVVVVDGRIGYTGGFGIDDKWFGDGHSADEWRDTNVRFTGPAVAQLQATFAAGWVEATGQLLTGDLFFPHEPPQPGAVQLAALFHSAPTIGSTPAERYLALSIAGARKTLYITNSYFVPDDDFRNLLERAARRGVDVRVLTAGQKTDVKVTLWAGRDRYPDLLDAGVKIYEYQPTMMHAKTLVVDGVWSSIGTMNFDNRSMVFNDESNLLVLDPDVGARMDSLFLDDLRYSKEIEAKQFERRGVGEKIMERGATLLSRVL